MVLEIPKVIHESTLDLSQHIKAMRSMLFQNNHDMTLNYELESRFGVYKDKTFVPGVSEEMGQQIEQMLESYDHWDHIGSWEESHDYFYTHQGQRIRTSVSFDGGNMMATHLLKTTIAKITMGFEQNSDVCVRTTISQEQKIHPKVIPDIVKPNFVRIKQRRSFKNGCWAFDLTRTWCGNTRQDAETLQDQGKPTIEFEIECIKPKEYFQSEYHTDEYVATSMILKMRDFMPLNYNSMSMHTMHNTSTY